MSPSLPDRPWKQTFRRRLLAWYRANARDLPWRRTRDPYAIWISEIMLQQTQVATVVPYYERFLQTFPTVNDLAIASEADVLRLWEGLGYYRRARQLHQAAQKIVTEHEREFPVRADVLQSLPGIGRYTAGAILSIALDAREPILEANTERLFCRLLAYSDDPRQSVGKRLLWSLATELLPRKNVGIFNQALMELGSAVCTPRSPACPSCPVGDLCATKAQGLQAQIPAAKKTVYERVREAAVVTWRDRCVLVRQCETNERWAGLWDFPRFEITQHRGRALERELVENVASLTGIDISPGPRLATIKYGVTRFRITLSCFEAECRRDAVTNGSVRWVEPSGLQALPLSVTGRRISDLIQDQAAGLAGRGASPSGVIDNPSEAHSSTR